jgi:HTH-type transcriptional regulator/antitoxin HigA
MTNMLIPAEAFPPGEFLRDELAERGWAASEFAEIIGRPAQAVSEILNGKKEITPETAVAIGAALGTGPELWLNLQAAYRLHEVRSAAPVIASAVERRAKLRSLVPVRELQKRAWLPTTDDLDELQHSVCDLLGIASIEETPRLAVAARRSNIVAEFTPEQTAWVARIQQLGTDRVDAAFDVERLAECAEGLVKDLSGPHDLGQLPDVLARCGVALVVELPLRSSKIDGVVSFSGENPIIGLSTRGDRMDSFVFTLLHEIAHLTLGHVGRGDVNVDEDLDPSDGRDREREANDAAARWIFPKTPVVAESATSARSLLDIADAHGVHPCFLIGRLQNEGRLGWNEYRRTIPKVRPFVKIG